jgi:hypothetical protein
MSVSAVKGREVRLVAKGRDLATFREGLQIGQTLHGRVLEIFSSGKVLLHIRGQNLFAETRGIKLNKGQTLTLSVQDLSQKIELKWIPPINQSQIRQLSASSLTLNKLLGMLNRLQEVFFAILPESNSLVSFKKSSEKLREKACRRSVFLPKSISSNKTTLIMGEIITSSGGYPSVMRITKESENDNSHDQSSEKLWFEWGIESEGLGPIVFMIYRNNGQLHCLCYVLNEILEFFGKHSEQLILKLKELDYPTVKVTLKTFDDSIPDIISLLDQLFEKNVNLIV